MLRQSKVKAALLLAGSSLAAPTTTFGLASLVYLGLISSTLQFFLFQRGLEESTPFLTGSASYLAPVSAAIFGWFILGEQLNPITLIFAGLILAGSTINLLNEQAK